MAIKITKENNDRFIESIKHFFSETLDEDIGDLKATLFLDFCLKEICPSVYNHAIANAQAFMSEKISDLENSCYEPEYRYWKK